MLKYAEQSHPQASGIGAYLVTTVCICCVPSYPFLSLPLPTPWLLLRLSLEVMTILCRCENIETSEGVPLFVTGVAQVITHLLPPLYLTFSLPALWGLASRSRMDSPPESVPSCPLLPPLLLWVPGWIPVNPQLPCPPHWDCHGERARYSGSSAKVGMIGCQA